VITGDISPYLTHRRHWQRAEEPKRRANPSIDDVLPAVGLRRSAGGQVRHGGPSRITGLAAAVGGALIGARFGFDVTSAGFGLFTPLLAIVGATVGANLILLAIDIAWDWQARDRFPRTRTKESLESRTLAAS
jgi:hypothetical protein